MKQHSTTHTPPQTAWRAERAVNKNLQRNSTHLIRNLGRETGDNRHSCADDSVLEIYKVTRAGFRVPDSSRCCEHEKVTMLDRKLHLSLLWEATDR